MRSHVVLYDTDLVKKVRLFVGQVSIAKLGVLGILVRYHGRYFYKRNSYMEKEG